MKGMKTDLFWGFTQREEKMIYKKQTFLGRANKSSGASKLFSPGDTKRF